MILQLTETACRNWMSLARFLCFVSISLCIALVANSQVPVMGIHEEEWVRHEKIKSNWADQSIDIIPTKSSATSSGLSHRVFGYHPYWASSSDISNYDYSALTDVGFFSANVDTASGEVKLPANYSNSARQLLSLAHGQNVRVSLVVVNFGFNSNSALLNSQTKRNLFIQSVILLLHQFPFDGVNLDFESVRSTDKTALAEIVASLDSSLNSNHPAVELTMAVPAVDWSNVFINRGMLDHLDFAIIMGYDYYWSGSPTAGPVSPLLGGSYNVTTSIESYLRSGYNSKKILLGIPWYGRSWTVLDSSPKARTDSINPVSSALTFGKIATMPERQNERRDLPSRNVWFPSFSASRLRQIWYDDSISHAAKFDLVKSSGLAGIGIWALSYQGNDSSLWKGIKAAFSTPADVSEEKKLGNEVDGLIQVARQTNQPIVFELYSLQGRKLVRLEKYEIDSMEKFLLAVTELGNCVPCSTRVSSIGMATCSRRAVSFTLR